MKISSKYLLHTAAALLICSSVASCSDEMVIGEHHVLQPGEYPLVLTASVGEMTSRSNGKDSWVDGDRIAVRIGQYPNVGCYMLNSDGTVMSAEKSLDWHTTETTTVTAWFPYLDLDKDMTVNISDQSQGFEEYDFLTAVEEDQSYNNAVNLNFKHQMSKISCTLVKGEGISDKEFETAKLNIAGFTKASFSNGVLTGSYKDGDENNNWITPLYDNDLADKDLLDYEALVVPQDMRGKDFIKIDIKVNHNGTIIDKTLVYQPTEATANFKAGSRYSYTVIVKKDRLEVQSISAEWEDNGEEHPAAPATFLVKLKTNEKLPELIFSRNVVNEGDTLIVTGNRFSISYVVNNDNITKALEIYRGSDDTSENANRDPNWDPNRDIVTREVVEEENDVYRYVFNYYLLNEEVTLVYADFVQPGDYYYEDGTWGPSIFKDIKRPIGIVFKSGAGEDDNVSNYNKEDLKVIHGYAVALNDATSGRIVWGAAKTFVTTYGGESTVPNSPYSGYNYTKLIKATGDQKGYDYAAVNAALDYGIDKAPESSSGWYLPSIKQQRDIQYIPDRANLFIYAGGKDFFKDGQYWSCVERSSSNAYAYLFDPADPAKLTVYAKKADVKDSQYVRAVLTF